MYQVNEDNSIYVTRGDIVIVAVSAVNKIDGMPYTFQQGEVLRIKVYGKKNAENVVLQKDFPITKTTQTETIFLSEEDTKIGEPISKPKDYWYEIELNPYDNPQTIIGYDEDGAKVFKLFPEGDDIPEYVPDPEVVKVIDTELDMASERPVQNQVIARAFANLQAGYKATHDAVANLYVTPKMFGAVGDGVTDDTEAFKAANEYITQEMRKNHNIKKDGFFGGIRLRISNGIYKVSGSNIFGSIESGIGDEAPLGYYVDGDNSTILWYVNSEEDSLFNFDYTITNPTVKNLDIYVINENATSKTYFGNVFNIHSEKVGGVYYANASCGLYEKIRVTGGRNESYITNSPKAIFKVSGDGMCDQSLVLKCVFTEFGSIYNGTNTQAVNWNFKNCSAHTSQENAVYFDVSACDDNFIIDGSSFSMASSQTFLRCIGGEVNGKLTNRPDYNFIVQNNRIEIVSLLNDDANFYLCDMNYGVLSAENTCFLLGGQSVNVTTVVKLQSHGSFNANNCMFGKARFIIPCVDSAIAGAGDYKIEAITLNNCRFISYEYKVSYNGLIMDYTDTIGKMYYMRHVHVRDCSYLASAKKFNYEICSYDSEFYGHPKTMVYSNRLGVALGAKIYIPPYQYIKSINLCGMSSVPSNYKTIRVYFGNEAENKYYDFTLGSTNPVNHTLNIFKGKAAVIKNAIEENYITIYFMVDGVKTGEVGSFAEIEHLPLHIGFLRKSTATEETIVNYRD